MYIGVVLAVGIIFACVYLSPILKNKSLPQSAVMKPETQPTAATTKLDCLGMGGQWISHDTPNAQYKCDPPTKDGGKECTDSSQCESYCVTTKPTRYGAKTTGECFRYHEFISIQTVNNGIAQPVAIE